MGDAAADWEVARKDVDRKETLRRLKERKKPVRGAVLDRTWDVRAEETRRLQLYEEEKAESEKTWEKEDALAVLDAVLDAVDLQTLDTIARKGMEYEVGAALGSVAASPTLHVGVGDEIDLASLTPAERRRLKNRRHMRRKARAGDWEGDPREHHAPEARSETKSSTQGVCSAVQRVVTGVGVLGVSYGGE